MIIYLNRVLVQHLYDIVYLRCGIKRISSISDRSMRHMLGRLKTIEKILRFQRGTRWSVQWTGFVVKWNDADAAVPGSI
jgi:hypothetical protein